MLRLLSTVIGHPVISQREGQTIASVREAICDPDRAKVIAYRVSTAPGFLSTTDVQAYLDDGILITGRDTVQPEDDLIRVKRLGAKRTALIGLKVVTEQGKRVGRVSDALIETDGHFLAKVHIRPGWPARLWHSERIIPRERIIRLTSREIIVRYDNEARPVGAEPEIAQ